MREHVRGQALVSGVLAGAAAVAMTLGATAPAAATDLDPDSVTACKVIRPMQILTLQHDYVSSTMLLTATDTDGDGLIWVYFEQLLDGEVYWEGPFEWYRPTDIRWEGPFDPELVGHVLENRLYSVNNDLTKADPLCSVTTIHKLTGRR